MEFTGAQALMKSLEMQGVEVMFGLPGGAILPVYDPIIDSPIRHILVRHEQGAGHMAEGYAQVTGQARGGHGDQRAGRDQHRHPARRRLHGLDPAGRASPARWPRASIGTDAFQECDITGITMGITKHNWLITDADDIPEVVREAFHVATTGRPGPVLDRHPQGRRERQPWSGTGPTVTISTSRATTRRPTGDPACVREAADADLARRAAGHLRRRRDPEGPCRPRPCASWPS